MSIIAPGAARARRAANCRPGPLQRFGVVVEDVGHVGHEKEGVEFERELGGVLDGVEVAVMLGTGGQRFEGCEPASEEGGDLLFHPAGVGVELGCRGNEEAASGEHAPLEVAEERLAESFEPGQRRFDGFGWVDDVVPEDRGRGLDRGELKRFLGAEVGVNAALAYADVLGEPPDRESLEPLDRGETGRGVEDRATAAVPVGTRLARAEHHGRIHG